MESTTIPSSPRTCPYTVTVRRNPPRKARATPSTSTAAACSSISQNRRDIAPLRLQEILDEVSENLRVFLRIRPLDIGKPTLKNRKNMKNDNATKKKNKMEKSEICLVVKDCRSVMLLPPASLQDSKRVKTQVYDGFNHVFASGSLQEEVYEKVMEPLVSDFLRGKSGMLAAMGCSGSGKTHTIFGCPREPGIVPLTLRQLFHHINRNCSDLSRSYYISMFEISSERGKGEKIFDLTSDGADLCLQQSVIKGLQEILVSDVTEAECVIARGMLKRATAMTNANSQSSRSQCIINIHSVLKKINDEKAEVWSKNAVLTIVDIAGAERERRTGNQGARLLESNFINNTSMVFGLCLRSLLEHQKNPKRPLQKHFQNSLLTRYLRDYLEGKKRMTLILTAKPGEDDYLDTTYLLRQASPYMKIKFNDVEEPFRLLGQKRHIQTLPRIEQPKRKKFRDRDASVIDGDGAGDGHSVLQEEVILEQHQEPEPCKVSGSSPRQLRIKCNGCKFLEEEYCIKLSKRDRHDQIMQNFSKALWDVLKEYKKKLEVSENEVHNLKESLQKEKFRSSELQEELKELKHLEMKNNYKVHAEASAPKSEISECGSTSNSCDAVLCRSLEMSLQIHAESCAPKLGVSEISSTSNSCHDVLCKNQEMSLQLHAEACAPKPEIPECNNTSNLCDGVLCKSERSPQVHDVEVFAPKPEVLECISTSKLCDATVCKSPEMSLQVYAEACALNPDVPECSNTPSLCDAFVCETPETSPLVHAPKPEVPECNNTSNLCDADVRAQKCSRLLVPSVVDVPKGEAKHWFSNTTSSAEKPRRRLGPPPSLLLKDISNLDLRDDNKPEGKGSRGGRKSMTTGRALTQGSISLLKLLGNYHHL